MKKVLVIGAAKSGIAVSKLLALHNYEVILTDAKEVKDEKLKSLGIRVYDGGHPDFLKDEDYDFIVKNPGIPYTVDFVDYFVKKGMKIYNEIEVACHFAHYRYGAITGTNGKTTTTTLLGAFLKKLNPLNTAVGNIGLPLSEVVMKYPDEALALAVEIAAFQLLGTADFHPEVAVCLNLTPDHLDYFGSLNKYYDAKMRIWHNMGPSDTFLLNLDDEEIVKRCHDLKCQVITYSFDQKADLAIKKDGVYLYDELLFKADDLKLVGMHNLQNAAVAACMAYKMGVSIVDIQEVIKEFKGVEHRIEFVKEVDGVRFYNDSKGTNPDSTIVALKAFDKPLILLAGGYDKKTGFKQIIPYLNKIKKLYCFGATKKEIKELYPEAVLCDDLKTALEAAKKDAEKGDVILLSPMCASWDQFPNYEVRGRYFKELVEDL